MTLKEAATDLRSQFPYDNNIQAIGIREKGEYNDTNSLVIYLNKKSNVKYPDNHEGYPVKTIVVGKLRLL